LTKLTIGFAVVFLINTLLLSIMYTGGSRFLMGRYGATRPIATRPTGPTAPARPTRAARAERATAAKASANAPIQGAPTLPGANLGDESVPAGPQAAAEPAEQPVPAEQPAAAEQTAPAPTEGTKP
jgi:hypothetical protein